MSWRLLVEECILNIGNLFCGETTAVKKNNAQRNVKNIRKAYLNKILISYKVYFLGSFEFNNQHFAQTKEKLAGTYVPMSPAFRNSGRDVP